MASEEYHNGWMAYEQGVNYSDAHTPDWRTGYVEAEMYYGTLEKLYA